MRMNYECTQPALPPSAVPREGFALLGHVYITLQYSLHPLVVLETSSWGSWTTSPNLAGLRHIGMDSGSRSWGGKRGGGVTVQGPSDDVFGETSVVPFIPPSAQS